MDFNHNYIPDEIILHVFDQLNITSKIQFIFVNHYTLTHYYPYLKEMIYLLINQEYITFRKLLRKFSYSPDEINQLVTLGIHNINIVWGGCVGYYDLRYLFEIIFLYPINQDIIIQEINRDKKKENILFLINQIKKCISFNRFETILKINHNSSLYALHYTFKPISPFRNLGKTLIKRNYFIPWEYI
mgnify:CR=1 FL=1|tara:strand:- start:127 stop:687 length:561 start_codon:yes stop_codon:yes gene_type:complete